MISISKNTSLRLSCQFSQLRISTNLDYVDVIIGVDGEELLSGRYFASGGWAVISDMQSLLEEAMRQRQLSLMAVDVVAYHDINDSSLADYDRTTYGVLFCDRQPEVGFNADTFAHHFLTAASSRRIAPQASVLLGFYAAAGESLAYDVIADYVVNGQAAQAVIHGQGEGIASVAIVYTLGFQLSYIRQKVEQLAGLAVELLGFTVRCGNRSASFYVDRDIAPLDAFYFRNCFNLPDQIFLPADTVTKTKAERSVATLADSSLFYDFSAEQSFEVQSGGLTPAECHLAAQLFTAHEVNKPYADGIEELDFDAMPPVLITESTCEFSRLSDKPNSVKFTWRYATNGCTHPALPFSDIFTEPFNYVFK